VGISSPCRRDMRDIIFIVFCWFFHLINIAMQGVTLITINLCSEQQQQCNDRRQRDLTHKTFSFT
jgi:hypothetical protein